MKDEIWFEDDGKRIDLSKVTRLYPAVMIHAGGDSASVSLEWAELKADVVTVEAYVLICDFDPVGEVPVNRVELRYATKEALFQSMQEIAQKLQS